MGLRSILLIAAIVVFVVAAIGGDIGDLRLIPLGLALFAASFLVTDGALIGRRRG